MRSFRIVPRVFATVLLLGSAVLLAQPQAAAPQPASFERLDDLLSRDQVEDAVAELTALAAQPGPALPAVSPTQEAVLRRAVEAGRRHLGYISASAEERNASRRLVCLARSYFPDAPGSAQSPKDSEAPLRVGNEVSRPEIIGQIRPQYTPEAKEKGVSGVVITEATIDREGCVRNVRVLKGLPFGLDQAAVDALRRWTFEPAKVNGEPVRVYYVLTVNFQVEKEEEKGTAKEPSERQVPR